MTDQVSPLTHFAVTPSSPTGSNESRLICFLDILGYGELVDRVHTSVAEIDKIRQAFDGAVGFIEKYRGPAGSFKEQTPKPLYAEVRQLMDIVVLSDSIIITCPISGQTGGSLAPEQVAAFYLISFLVTISVFYISMVSRLGYFFRGGISIGQWFNAPIGGRESKQAFLLSKALVEAVRLQRVAKTPRVVIGYSVIEHLWRLHEQNSKVEIDLLEEAGLICRDIDGYNCLDIYEVMLGDPEPSRVFFEDIVKSLRKQLQSHEGDEKIVEKYRWFADYHNRKLKPLGSSFDALQLPKF